MLNDLLRYIPLNIISLLCGKLLGDANLTIDVNRQPRFRFQHCYSDKEWGEHCYNSLKTYLPLNPPKYKRTLDPRLIKGYSESIYVQSKTSPALTLLKEIWYKGRTKVVPLHLLEITLDAPSLAWWYQDDGHLTQKNGKLKKLILSTDNFTHIENQALVKLLIDKFHLNFSIDGQNRLILYDQPQIHVFLNIVGPHIHDSMNRKMNIDDGLHNLPFSKKRTTVYLDKSIIPLSPSKDIRVKINELNSEDFISKWFCGFYKHYLTKSEKQVQSIPYQIQLEPEHVRKLCFIQMKTGLRISEIINILFSNSSLNVL